MFWVKKKPITLEELIEELKKLMAAIDDLNAEVTAIGTSVTNAITAANKAIAAGANDSAVLETAVTNLKASQATLDAFTTSITPTT